MSLVDAILLYTLPFLAVIFVVIVVHEWGHYRVAVARRGGYLARWKDPPPGSMVVWRGLARLMDIHLGFELSRRIVGN